MIDSKLRGEEALKALDGRLFAYPAEVAAVLERNLRVIYDGLERGEIPHVRIGQRYQIPVAWLRRQAEGVAA